MLLPFLMIMTAYDIYGNSVVPASTITGTAFDFVDADSAMIQTSIDEPYYGLVSGGSYGTGCV